MKCGFTMLPSYYDALRPLPDKERLTMYDAIFGYVFEGKEPKDLPAILNGYFLLLRPNIDSSIKRYAAAVENGKNGGRPPKKTKKKPGKNPSETQTKPSRKRDKEMETEMDRDRENTGADKPPRSRFVAPSVDEVRQYCRERNNALDPETFVDFYASKGWRVGKETMKDWKAAVRTWERREKKAPEEDPYEDITC